jgi:fermentation-respiration switch protein FrsA (DUF1100 family)
VLLEEKLIYFPEKHPGGLWGVEMAPGRAGEPFPRVEECWFPAEDGVRLHGWFCTPYRTRCDAQDSVPTDWVLLWFHGNAGNITHRYDMILTLMRLPARVFIVDYRGYGKSEGTPSEEGLYRDGKGAWDYLVGERKIPARQIVLFGKSLGGAVAVDLATRVSPGGLIVQSSFTSIPDMARSLIPFFPRFLLRHRMESIEKIPRVSCPKLFVHSPSDEIVPYEQGRRLYEAASQPKHFHTVEGASHNDTYLVGGESYLVALRRFLESCRITP